MSIRSSVLASLLLTLWVGCALEDAGRTGGGKDGGQGSGGTDPTGSGGSSPTTTGTGGSTTTGTGGSTTTTGTGGSTTTGTGGSTTGTGGTGGATTTTGTGGTTTGTGGTGGTGGATTTTGTGGATTGTGGAGGAGGAAGTGGATTGTGGTGGAVDAGGKGGAAGTGGTGPADSGSGSDASLIDVARVLDGKVITLRCGTDSGMRVCNNRPAGSTACPTNADPVLLGNINTNETVKFGGTPGTTYNVTIHVQGVVEAKPYQNGMDTSLDGANGWYVGGAPNHNGNAYNVYAIRVANPKQDYFLNSIAISGNNRLNHAAYIIDYTVTLPIQGGSDVTLVASDSNCSAIKNCAEPVNETMCNPHTVPNLEPKIVAGLPMAQPWPGQFAGIAVKSVTQ